ncbi:GrpB family protein [Prauserella cavernicola]|uniref:GrpB family protein n=1 Tax=Prauserella cavernicola TaxID=2800127 RepID=A0A934QR98_9PSEU|nr:GrpB family protein [Prauserella cavernicola]MBK1784711.1 GrpB family protein [Prauserella cavernicola]
MSDELDDAQLSAKLVNGLRPTRVTLADHDPAWPARFEARASELRSILGERARLIEHIGSTSVPGLAAKPIIDIVVGIDDPDDEAAYLRDLEAAGYDPRVREPGHRCLRAGEPDEPVNLHCYPPDDVEVRRYLAFRDRLRANDADRELYEATKRKLAEREWADINYYAEAKRPVIFEILARAGWVEPVRSGPTN